MFVLQFAVYLFILYYRCGMVVNDANEAIELMRLLARKYRIVRIKNTLAEESTGSFGVS